jgi:acyl-CoA thioesterase 8
MVSFCRPEAFELSHQQPMGKAPAPESVLNERETLVKVMPYVSKPHRDLIESRLTEPIPIEIRHTDPKMLLEIKKNTRTKQSAWIRAIGNLADLPLTFHQCTIAYASDHIFLTTALLAHGLTWLDSKVKHMATLDHSMWFHCPFRADEFMLYEMESPRTNGNRGLVLGRLYTQDGKLAVSCAQEGVIRTVMKDRKAKL